MSLFTSGDNGTFDTTTDPNGNPPSDWNITKAADAIVKFTDVDPITGTGSMHVESRTIFNDDYAFDFKSNLSIVGSDQKQVVIEESVDLDFSKDFEIEFEIYPKRLNYEDAQEYFNRESDLRCVIPRNSSLFSFVWGINESSSDRILSRPININQWNTVKVIFTQGVSVELIVNGNSIVNNDPLDAVIFRGGDTSIVNRFGGVQIGGGDRTTIDAIHRNFKLTFDSVLTREYKCNQEQGRQYWDSVNEEFSATCNDKYADSELQFGGGVWIDTTTL